MMHFHLDMLVSKNTLYALYVQNQKSVKGINKVRHIISVEIWHHRFVLL